MVDSLKTISEGIKMAGEQNEQIRQENNRQLGEPMFFIPDAYSEGHGLGFFKTNTNTIFAYRKYSDGYERYPAFRYEKDLVDKLYEAFKNAP